MTKAARLSSLLLVAALSAPTIGASAEVTPERLLHASEEPQNWLMNLGSYDGSRYSGLSQINRQNVGGLKVLYGVTLGDVVEGGGNYAAALPLSPLVEDGFIYVVDGWGKISKLDARKGGAVVWESDAGQHNLDAWLEASRGIALYRDYVISASADGTVHWIDAASGKLERTVQVADPFDGYTIVAPPLVVGDRIIVGGGGADRGARGRIDAIDARTGVHLWTTYSVPAPGEPGSETWAADGDAWRFGGATFEQTGVYDPATNLTIWGSGHPFPKVEADLRPGDNLFTNSGIALDAETGAMRWHFQYTPGDSSGFSEVGTHILAPSEGGGTSVVHFGNNGFFYSLDAGDGRFRSATPYVAGIEWTAGLDPDTGEPLEYRPDAAGQAHRPGLWGRQPGCPNIRSVPAFAAALSKRTGLAYGAGADGCQPGIVPVRASTTRGWYGAYYSGAVDAVGTMSALDPSSGELVASRSFEYPLHSSALATAGGLVFTTTADGSLHALNDETLATVWSQKLATLTPVPPVTFLVDGKQRVAVVVGGNAMTGSLSYRPSEMSLTESLFVLLVLGIPE